MITPEQLTTIMVGATGITDWHPHRDSCEDWVLIEQDASWTYQKQHGRWTAQTQRGSSHFSYGDPTLAIDVTTTEGNETKAAQALVAAVDAAKLVLNA